MDFKTFLENFDAIAEAPGGIPKLRSLILDLAVRGKLVPQNPEDETIQIALSKHRKTLDSKVKKLKIASKLILDKLPEIPEGWCWVQMMELATEESNAICAGPFGTIFKAKDFREEGVPIIFLRHVSPGQYLTHKPTYMDKNKWVELFQPYSVYGGELLITKLGDPPGVCAIYPLDVGIAMVTPDVIKMSVNRALAEPKYLMHYLNSTTSRHFAFENAYGLTRLRMNMDIFRTMAVPLPPLTEQKRIVEKVDELRALCDRYEAAKQTRDNLRQKLRESVIASLMNAETDEDLDAAWAIVRDSWCEVSQCPEDVDDLRRAVLQLAVRGRLVSQNSGDKPASEISKSIDEEYRYLLSQKSINRNQILPSIKPDEYPFNLPCGWIFARLGNLVNPLRDITYGIIKLGAEPKSGGVKTLRCSDVLYRNIDTSRVRSVEQELSQQYNRTILEGGEIVMNIRGTLGGCAVVPDECKGYNIAREVAVIPINFRVYNRYILDVISSPLIQQSTIQNLRGIAYKGLNLNLLRQFVIPLPPLAEQKRIVAKVDELMQLCDQLEVSLRQSQQWAESLAASAISHLTI
jgi:type I restriction enzyme S subunit